MFCLFCTEYQGLDSKCRQDKNIWDFQEVLDMYNTNGCYVRDIKFRKFELENECLPVVEKPKTHTVELTDEQYELLQSILDGRT